MESTATLQNQRVLIVGGGIAGPALAYWLRRYGFTPTIVERAPEIRPGGYKIDIRGAAVQVVDWMGLLPVMEQRQTDIRGGDFFNSAGKKITTANGDLIGFRDPGDLELLRGDLAQMLYQATEQEVEYIFDDMITSLTQDETGVQVTFEQAPARTFDLVVGADGLHSQVRSLVFGTEAQFALPLGLNVAIYSLPNYLKLDQWEASYSTPGHIVNLYSARQTDQARVLYFFPTPAGTYDRRNIAQQQQLLATAFRGHRWEVPRLLAAMDDAPDFYFDQLVQIQMPQWSNKRVTLIGDAGYCPSPASGQGTSLALVGAYLLARELAAADGDHQQGFASYERIMRPYVELNQQLGRTIIHQLVPPTRLRVWLNNLMMRLLPYIPNRQKMIAKIMEPIRKAANGIVLPTPL